MATGLGGGGTGSIAPYPGTYFVYKYVYKGTPITLPDKNVNVLRRVKGTGAIASLGNLVNQLGLGLVNISSFGTLKPQSISLMQENSDGYNVFVDLIEGMISIQRQYGVDYYLSSKQPIQPIKITDMPADSVIIDIAKSFLSEHGISTADYGAPEVQNDWRIQYERMSAADRTQFYIPESVSVVFPQLIDGETVYEEGGATTGLMVPINVRNHRADGVWNLSSQKYEGSSYTAVTDVNKVMAAVEKGNFRNYPQPELSGNAVVKEIEVGTPIKGYVRIWNYDGGKNNELLVPSLMFPVTKIPADELYFWQRYVVIPLAQELLDQPVDGGVRPL
ncbi:MAG: hypothetical protein KW806_00025 [Candidatus Yanofskybacteria bacterium]|nr:hypothetical protein [Candidatus Yanofskybacteria bacterium]